MSAFNIIALDKNYQIVALLRPTNVQWNRMYYEPGNFSIQLPIEQYKSSIRYLYSKDRSELGKVIQVNYLSQSGFRYMQLSGYFEERDLNRHVVYPKGTSNMVTEPGWTEKSGPAEDVAYAFFDGFKNIGTSVATSTLRYSLKSSLRRGKQSCHHRNGEYLGSKLYDILKPSEMSYRILYDFESSIRMLEVWQGRDRSEQNVDGNNPIVFSTKYGNIKNPNVLISEENYKTSCIINHTQSDGETEINTLRLLLNNPDSDGNQHFLYAASTLNKADYSTGFETALENEAQNALVDYTITSNVEFDSNASGYEYMVDFDLGDKCSLEIPEMNFSADARIIGCYEVMKSGQWTMTLEFGTPILKK